MDTTGWKGTWIQTLSSICESMSDLLLKYSANRQQGHIIAGSRTRPDPQSKEAGDVSCFIYDTKPRYIWQIQPVALSRATHVPISFTA